MQPLNRFRSLLLACSLFGVLAHVPSAAAQSFLYDNAPGAAFSLEWAKPSFDNSEGLSFLTSTLRLAGRVPITPRSAFVGSVPISHMGFREDDRGGFEPEESTGLGNPYLGIQAYTPDGAGRFGVGVHLPLARGADALFVGVFADFDRFEDYASKTAALSAEAAYRYNPAPGFRLEGAFRPAFLMPTGGNGADGEVFLHYEVQGWYGGDAVEVGIGLSGLALATEKNLELGERTVHHATLYVAGTLGNVRPGAYLRLPFEDDLGDVIDFVFGLGVAVRLSR